MTTELTTKLDQLELQATCSEEQRGDACANKFYVTTAIHYTNGPPHMGHAYENVTADVIARYHRIAGRDVFFATGTDEHGLKIAQTAETQGLTPRELCDKYAAVFRQLAADLDLSNDVFVRTTSEDHKRCAQWFFQRALDNGDIYLGTYRGWYNVREEAFVSETEAAKTDYKDPSSGVPYAKMEEPSYFFKLSKYHDRLVQHLKDHPTFFQPEARRLEILGRLESEPLVDLSVSRCTFSHGIPLSNDPTHVMYVWFDALANYASAIDYPHGANAKFWPANVHVLGKDVMWFHAVIWPCMLWSVGVPLPKHVFAHGHVTAKDGTKMSKSIGNVVDPYDMINKYGLETFRYFTVRGGRYGHDLPFSEDDLVNIHNSELADTLGNLVHRAVVLCDKYADGVVPDVPTTDRSFDVATLLSETETAYRDFALQRACLLLVHALRETNKYLTDTAPWHLRDDDRARVAVVRTCLEAIYVVAHLLGAILPATADKIFAQLGTQPKRLPQLSPHYDNLVPGTPITIGGVLFDKIVPSKPQETLEAPIEKKPGPPVFASLDIRVGVISNVWGHPEADSFCCAELDIGEPAPVAVASELRAFYALDDLKDRKVLVVLNIKPTKVAGFKSHGVVLCATNETHGVAELIKPPSDAVAGERVYVDAERGDPLTPAQVKKQKVWEKALAVLRTSADGVATYKRHAITTAAGGVCRVASLVNASIN